MSEYTTCEYSAAEHLVPSNKHDCMQSWVQNIVVFDTAIFNQFPTMKCPTAQFHSGVPSI